MSSRGCKICKIGVHTSSARKTRRCCENRDASAVSHRRRRACARRHDADASHACTRRPQRLHAVWRPCTSDGHTCSICRTSRRVPERRDFGAVVNSSPASSPTGRSPASRPTTIARSRRTRTTRAARPRRRRRSSRQRPTASRRAPCRRATTTHRCTSLASRCRRRCACGSPPTRPLPPTTRCGPRAGRARRRHRRRRRARAQALRAGLPRPQLGASSRRCSSLPTRCRRRRRPVPA